MNPVQKALKQLRDKELVVGEIKKVPTGLVTLQDAEEILQNLEIYILNQELYGRTIERGRGITTEISVGEGFGRKMAEKIS